MRSVYTLVKLEVEDSTYEEIAGKLREAGYDHVFLHDGGIDMTHIALVKKEDEDEEQETLMPE